MTSPSWACQTSLCLRCLLFKLDSLWGVTQWVMVEVCICTHMHAMRICFYFMNLIFKVHECMYSILHEFVHNVEQSIPFQMFECLWSLHVFKCNNQFSMYISCIVPLLTHLSSDIMSTGSNLSDTGLQPFLLSNAAIWQKWQELSENGMFWLALWKYLLLGKTNCSWTCDFLIEFELNYQKGCRISVWIWM